MLPLLSLVLSLATYSVLCTHTAVIVLPDGLLLFVDGYTLALNARFTTQLRFIKYYYMMISSIRSLRVETHMVLTLRGQLQSIRCNDMA